MSEFLSITFDSGDNQKHRLEWDFLDTPPAREWRRLTEYGIDNPKMFPVHYTDVSIVVSTEAISAKWRAVSGVLRLYGVNEAIVPFERLVISQANKVLETLMNLARETEKSTIAKINQINQAIRDLKHVMYFLNTKNQGETNRTDIVEPRGEILHLPDSRYTCEWDEGWNKYLTMDIEPGTIYAELGYTGLAWTSIIRFSNKDELSQALLDKRFGLPAYLGSGVFLPMGPDMFGLEPQLTKHLREYRECFGINGIPTAEQVYSLCGRIPVARLRNEYQWDIPVKLADAYGVFKMEILED